MGMLAYLRNTLKKGAKVKDAPASSTAFTLRRDTMLFSSSSSKARRESAEDESDDDDGWDFGARQTPDRSLHTGSVTPSRFARASPAPSSTLSLSRILSNTTNSASEDDVSRSSSVQSWHPTKPMAEGKRLPPVPAPGLELQGIASRSSSYTITVEESPTLEPQNHSSQFRDGNMGAGGDASQSSPLMEMVAAELSGPSLPEEGVVLVAAGAIAKEIRQSDRESFAQRRRRAQSFTDVPSRRPVIRHMASAYSVKDVEGYEQAYLSSAPVASSSKVRLPESSPPSSVRSLGPSHRARQTTLAAKRSMPQLEGVWEHLLEETSEDSGSLSPEGIPRRASTDYVAVPPRRSSKATAPEFGHEFAQQWRVTSAGSGTYGSRPPLPRHSSSPSASSSLTIASISSATLSPSLSSMELRELMANPPSRPSAPEPTAPAAHRSLHQRRKHRSSNLTRNSNQTMSSTNSSMSGSGSLSSLAFSMDGRSVSSMTTVQDDDEEADEPAEDDVFTNRNVPPANDRKKKRPEDLTLLRSLPSHHQSRYQVSHTSTSSSGAGNLHHQSSSSNLLRNGLPSPSSILSFSSHGTQYSTCYSPRSTSESPCPPSPALTPVGTPTPTTASFPVTPPLSRSSSRSTPQLRHPRSRTQPGQGGGSSPPRPHAMVWPSTPPMYTDDEEGTLDFGFPRTPSSFTLPYLPGGGGKLATVSASAVSSGRRHMQQPSSDSSSCSEDACSQLAYLRRSPVQVRAREIMHGRSKSTSNLKASPSSPDAAAYPYPPISELPPYDPRRSPAASSVLHLTSAAPQMPPRTASPKPSPERISRPAHARRMHSDSDAISPYHYSSSSPSPSSSPAPSLSYSPSPHSSPLRRPSTPDSSLLPSPTWSSPSPSRAQLPRSQDSSSPSSASSLRPHMPSRSPLYQSSNLPLPNPNPKHPSPSPTRPLLDTRLLQPPPSSQTALLTPTAKSPGHPHHPVQWGYAL